MTSVCRLPHFKGKNAMSLMRNLCLLSTTMLTAAVLASPVLAQAKVTVLTIGYPDEDTTDAISGVTAPGIGKLEAAFEAANPNIDLVITNIPWGSGATGYAPKTEAMMQAKHAGARQTWTDDVPSLRDFAPATFEVEDPQSISELGLGMSVTYDTDADWELASPVGRTMRFRHTVHA